MPIPAQWITNNPNDPTCKGCGSKEFNEIGECKTCGKILIIYSENTNIKTTKMTRKQITAAEKWHNTRIPKDYQNRCAICGNKLEKPKDIYESKTISIMVTMYLKQQPQYKQAVEIAKEVYNKIKIKEKEIQLITKALIHKQNIILPAKNVEKIYSKISKFLKEDTKPSVCLTCLNSNGIGKINENKDNDIENQQSTMSSAMKKAVENYSKESKDMGPKFKPELKKEHGWGQEVIDHEEWKDDPVEYKNDWDEDDWEQEITKDKVSTNKTSTSTQSQDSIDEGEDFGDPFNDGWEEDLARFNTERE